MTRKAIPVLVACVLLAPGALAKGLFIGASVGQGDVTIPGASVRLSKDETTYKGFVGYMFSNFWGLEGSYTGLGSVSGTVEGVDISADLDGFSGFLVGNLPTSPRLDIFAKLGYGVWDIKARFTDSSGTTETEPDGSGLAWGIGVAYKLTPSLALRLEYETLDLDDDLKFTTLGVQYDF